MGLATIRIDGSASLQLGEGVRVLRRDPRFTWIEATNEVLEQLSSSFPTELAAWEDPPLLIGGWQVDGDPFAGAVGMPSPAARDLAWLVRLPLPPDARVLDAIRRAPDVALVGVLGGRVIEIAAPVGALPLVAALVTGATEGSVATRFLAVRPEWKLVGALRTLVFAPEPAELAALARGADGAPVVRVRVRRSGPRVVAAGDAWLAPLLPDFGAKVVHAHGAATWVDLPLQRVGALAGSPIIRSISRRPPPEVLSRNVREVVGLPQYPSQAGDSDGFAQLVAVIDCGCGSGRADTLPTDLQGRVTFAADVGEPTIVEAIPERNNDRVDGPGSQPTDGAGHGTAMVGLVAGSAAAARLALGDTAAANSASGAAPRVEVHLIDVGYWVVWSDANAARPRFGPYALPYDLGTAVDRARDMGAGVVNLSIATSTKLGELGGYTDEAWELDAAAMRSPETLIVVAAGNSGNAPSSLTPPSTARNVLAIGATGGVEGEGGEQRPAAESGRPPTLDGRRKPELLAPGVQLVQVQPQIPNLPNPFVGVDAGLPPELAGMEWAYRRASGTSAAAAVTSGVVAVVRQRIGGLPSAALLRALLGASARRLLPSDHLGVAPDAVVGIGILHVGDLVGPDARTVSYHDERGVGLAETERWSASVGWADRTRPLVVALAWTDPAAWQMASLQNQLRLSVRVGTVTLEAEPSEGTDALGQPIPLSVVNNLQRVDVSADRVELAGVDLATAVIEVVVVAERVTLPGPEVGARRAQHFAVALVNGRLDGVGVPLQPPQPVVVDPSEGVVVTPPAGPTDETPAPLEETPLVTDPDVNPTSQGGSSPPVGDEPAGS